MAKLGFYYNMNTCVGCGACQLACKDAHGLKPGEFYRRIRMQQEGPYSGSCNHCQEAACVSACPTGAMYKAKDGTTRHDDGKCIGCGACMWNCPYGAVSFSRTRGVTQKCDSCAARREQGLEPYCTAACPTGSLRFGPLDNISPQGVVSHMDFLADPSKTQPSLKIKPSKRAEGKNHD